MKYAIATLTLIFNVVFAAIAGATDKTTNGIYLTADDFKNGNLRYEGLSGDPSHKLKLHDVTDKPYIDVTHREKTAKFNKSEVYGFRDSHGRSYRFVGNFSAGPTETVLPLTIANVKKAVPGDSRFHDAVDMMFRSDSDLTAFEKLHNYIQDQSTSRCHAGCQADQ